MIRVEFACGHTMQATGDEQGLRCGCGETQVVAVQARPPRFRGHALGPCATFENLPAQAVTLGRSS